jgi:uncharacterized membrane protein
MTGETGRRFWEVDAARGVAMVMVVLYHLVYDLDTFAGYGIESTSGFWAAFADASAFAFIFLAGLSLAISFSREQEAGRRGWDLFGKYLRRGARIFAYGMLITVVFLALGYGYVIFGVLHLIGVSIVLAYPFRKLRYLNVVLGLAVVAAGAYVPAEQPVVGAAAGVLLAPLGVVPENLFMPDYRPLLPWFGVVLLGLFAGNMLYAGRSPRKSVAGLPWFSPARPLAFLGRHTLLIYLIHQPILIATLWALGVIEL